MLTSPEYLTIVVEFSIGLAGFSAIVSVFQHSSGQLRKIDKHRVTNLLCFALIPGFISLSCIGLELLLHDIETATRISSGLLALALILLTAFALYDRRSIPIDQAALVRRGMGASVFIPMTTLIVLAQISVVLALVDAPSTFFFGLLATLLLGVIQFARIILLRTNDGNRPPPSGRFSQS